MMEKRRVHPFLFPLCALLLAAAAPPSAPKPRPAQPARPAPAAKLVRNPEEVRRDLVLLLNRERELAGSPPLAPSGPLHQVAQARAEEMLKNGGLPNEAEAMLLFRKVQGQLTRAGYSAHGWAESVTTAPAGLEAAIAAWKKEDPTYVQAMDIDYQHVGVGVVELAGSPLCVFLFAWPKSQFYARETSGLVDLEAVRREMLERVNAIRKEAGRPPLRIDPRLNTAAQAHADDMLARSYYNHISPEGTAPRQRVFSAGYQGDVVGENIAAGQYSVELVVDAWMHSREHRRNILEARFTDIGIGMAVGSYEHRYKVLWVQSFGRE